MVARRLAIIGLLLCLCLACLPCSTQAVSTADASEPLSPEKACSLTLSYTCNGITFGNLQVKLYKIAAVTAEAYYTLTPNFQFSGLEINGIRTTGEWDMIRSTLEAHILADDISPNATAKTDSHGLVTFDELEPGMYLVISEDGVYNELPCIFQPALVALPGLDEDGCWQYDICISPKPQLPPPVEPDELRFQVLKLWKDRGHEKKRPESIKVEIFRNGESYEIVILSEENNWSYHWTAPADGARWMVAERNVPEGYILTVEDRTTTIVLTNSVPKDPPGNPQSGDSANILLAVVLLNLSGAGLIALGLYRKRYTA